MRPANIKLSHVNIRFPSEDRLALISCMVRCTSIPSILPEWLHKTIVGYRDKVVHDGRKQALDI